MSAGATVRPLLCQKPTGRMECVEQVQCGLRLGLTEALARPIELQQVRNGDGAEGDLPCRLLCRRLYRFSVGSMELL